MAEPRTVRELLVLGKRVLDDSTHLFDEHDHQLEAEQLLAHVLDVDPDELDDDEEVRRTKRDRFLALVARRAGGEPMPFLLGYIEFYGLHLTVKPGAFVPRPSSELTVARAVKRLRRQRDPIVVDVCAGAGPIALGIADELSSADVWALDIHADGLKQGRRNAKRLGIDNITFRVSDMYDALPSKLEGRVDCITGHVPYVPPDELEDLPTEVREYEPLFTLTDESHDGMWLMKRAVEEAPRWLAPGGWLLLEMSDDLPPKVRRMMKRAGLEDHGVASDDDDLSVVVEARMPARPANPKRQKVAAVR